ncbi:nuclear transport factor 2 family protein [Undibacterium sp. LX40W]|uniref:Nuclear transport factor 2 family protein n=1 Tax=Undibacterium nitidum TaxID=2762298 RepID=A0A923HMW9_9BURK|nr:MULTISPECIES: nuclear transport factor 2 family protein [Undibacterium]MBC3880010.1 nuclear transport factor 2 family protein [Undibacterium nitidum]MBC3891254.1 nuclear transport factor 2 family protein [Undibacterium sp. LX40W]
MTPPVQAIVDWYSNLSEKSLHDISNLYVNDAFFKDPFNEVHDVEGIKKIFSHMFRTTVDPKFVFKEVFEQGNHVFLSWIFHFKLEQKTYEVHGATHLVLASSGKIELHRDYWDPAEELWQKLPILGKLVAWLRSKFKAH